MKPRRSRWPSPSRRTRPSSPLYMQASLQRRAGRTVFVVSVPLVAASRVARTTVMTTCRQHLEQSMLHQTPAAEDSCARVLSPKHGPPSPSPAWKKKRPAGLTTTHTMNLMVEHSAATTVEAKITTKAWSMELIIRGETCAGCVCETGGGSFKELGPVIFASGRISLLSTSRPDSLRLPATNGEQRTRCVIKVGAATRAETLDLQWCTQQAGEAPAGRMWKSSSSLQKRSAESTASSSTHLVHAG